MPRKAKAPPPPPPQMTREDIARMDAMGLRVVGYQNHALDGYWVPRDAIGSDGKTLLRWREAEEGPVAYAVAGWHPWHDGMSGGCCTTLGSALWWVQRARDIRAGLQSHF